MFSLNWDLGRKRIFKDNIKSVKNIENKLVERILKNIRELLSKLSKRRFLFIYVFFKIML